MLTKMFVLALAALMLGSAPPASACGAAGPNTHVGAITAIDLTQKTFILKDAETAKPIVFVASSDLLRGLMVEDEVVVTYVIEGKQLRARSVKKN